MLDTRIDLLPQTSRVTIKRLKSLGIETFYDLLQYFPYRYEDYSQLLSTAALEEGQKGTIKGTISSFKNTYARNHLTIQKALIEDNTGNIEVTWFNQPFLSRIFIKGNIISLSGTVKKNGIFTSIQPEQYEIISSFDSPTTHTGKIIPIYHEKIGLSNKVIREKMKIIINELKKEDEEELETMPTSIVTFNALMNKKDAYQLVHEPKSKELLHKARERLAFEELFTVQLTTEIIKRDWKLKVTGSLFHTDKTNEIYLEKFMKNVPFTLTNAQKKAVLEITQDLVQTYPMNRFLQGDVGSGKTVVAAAAIYFAHLNGYKSLYMAPTEILAQQHYKTLTMLLEPYGIRIGLQTGSKKIKKGSGTSMPFDVVIGTQAIIQKSFDLDNIGLVIIDEQHRFGVAQRAQLKEKGNNPHLLTMTATPIPRTVALTLYGDLSLSVLDEMPIGRIPIKTYLVPKQKREDSYKWIKGNIAEFKSQAFIICPLIEESTSETMKSIRAANNEYTFLKQHVFTEFSMGLLHGKMKPAEKQHIMDEFKNRKIDILVSTSVVEVGIDIPDATVIIIEAAERFGLAQLHQLRGRVGRGMKQSYCLLFTEMDDEKTLQRLKFFAQTTNGMELADYDLRVRGAGNIFGTEQHGYNELQIANLSDLDLIHKTKNAAQFFLKHESLENYPAIKQEIDRFNTKRIARD